MVGAIRNKTREAEVSMSKAVGEVKRRKRAPRDRIEPGEFRNVTFRAGSAAYNMLVELTNTSGYSVGEAAERVIQSQADIHHGETVRISPELLGKLKNSANSAGRALEEDVEARLNATFSQIGEWVFAFEGDNTKAGRVLRAMAGVFAAVSFEADQSAYLARAGLLAAFRVILESHFLRPGGLLADIFDPEDPALQKKVEDRLAHLAQQIVEAQRVAAPEMTEDQKAALPPFDPRQSEGTSSAAADKIAVPATKKQKRKI
jgi:hypothetical protein